MSWFNCIPLGACLLALSLASPAQQSSWKNFQTGQHLAPPANWNHNLPLSDQENKSRWVPFVPLTDDFRDTFLNPLKWRTFVPSLKGTPPGYYDPTNVVRNDQGLQLMVKKAPPSPTLKLTGERDYGGAIVEGVAPATYGYFEVEAKVSNSKVDDAFWFQNADPKLATELDVFEISGGTPESAVKDYMTLHEFDRSKANGHSTQSGSFKLDRSFADDYHVFGLDWSPQYVRFYLDGQLIRQGPNLHHHRPLMLRLSCTVIQSWLGLPTDESLPAAFSVQYVRAWQRL